MRRSDLIDGSVCMQKNRGENPAMLGRPLVRFRSTRDDLVAPVPAGWSALTGLVAITTPVAALAPGWC